MRVNNIQNDKMNFASGFHPESKAFLAKMITELKLKGRLQEAADCIQLTKRIKQKSHNHTISISEYLQRISVYADDSKIASDMEGIKVNPRTLKKRLTATEKFLDKDLERIPVVKKLSDSIFSQLKDTDDDFLSAGWHGLEDAVWSGIRYPDGKGRIIAGKLAKLSLAKKNPQVIEDGLKIFKSIKENPGNCRITIDNIGNFNVVNNKTKQDYLVSHMDFKKDDVLSQLKKLEKIVRREDRNNQILEKQEEARWNKSFNRGKRFIDRLQKREEVKKAFEQTSVYKFYKKIKDYISSRVQSNQKTYDDALSTTKKELGF